MKTYCFVCKKNTDNMNSKMTKTKTGRLQLKSQIEFVEIKKYICKRTKRKRIIIKFRN